MRLFGNKPDLQIRRILDTLLGLERTADAVTRKLAEHGRQLERIVNTMATIDDLRAAEANLKTQISATAASLQATLDALQAKIDQGVPAADFAQDVAALGGDIADLQALGSAQPTPGPTPVPTPTPTPATRR